MTTTRVLLSGGLAALAAGTLFGWSLVAGDLARELDVGPTATAGVFALALVGFTLTLLLVGPVADRTSPRPLLVAAAALCGAGLLLAAVAPGLAAVAVGVGGLFAVGSGTAYVVATGLAARLPRARRAHALGVVVGGYAAGPVALGAFTPPWVDAAGWRAALGWLAVAVTALLLVAAVVAPRAWPQRTAGGTVPATRSGPLGPVLLWAVFALASAPALAVFARAVELGAANGLDAAGAGRLLSGLAAGNLAGRLLAGPVAAWRGARAGLAASLVLEVASLVALLVSPAAVVLLLAVSALGLAYGVLSALVPAATAEVSDPAVFGRTYGRVFTGWGLAGLAAPLVAARLTAGGEWAGLLWLGVVAVALAAAALAALVVVARRPSPSPRG